MALPVDPLTIARDERRDGPFAAMPPEAGLPMPEQSFTAWSRREERQPLAPSRPRIVARLFVFGLTAALTLYGGWQMVKVVEVGGITALEWALVVLFIINFSWIALSFAASIPGVVALARSPVKPPAAPLHSRTAVLVPVYNEAPERVFGAVTAMAEAIAAAGEADAFDWFILSDTTDPDVWIEEEAMFLAMRRRLEEGCRVWYRHRPENRRRKPGNIADWVTRWGGAYDHMLVLDADSLMAPSAILTLAHAMEDDPDAGIIQSLPSIIKGRTLFARLQQFAGRVYGPVLAAGLDAWVGDDGNFWGHNAIIRTRAFAAHCGLPDLPGRPPFGGPILSHDFVEAALIRRAGWRVRLMTDLDGSFEESPPSLIDVAVRDRRWCQGNLQHVGVMFAPGLKAVSRQHFANGIFSYLASPLWLIQLVVGIVLVLQSRFVRPEYFTTDFALFPTWPRFDAERALGLFALTMAVLIAPKILGLATLLASRARREASGGGGLRLAMSTLVEIILSSLFAPIMMLVQSGSVFEILTGRDTGWRPQRRDDGAITWREIMHRHRWHMLFGLIAAGSAAALSPLLLAWMAPTILGLILAMPLSWASGQASIGLWLARHGLLLTPEEASPAPIIGEADAARQALARDGANGGASGLRRLATEPALMAAHTAMLPTATRAPRGRFDPGTVMARAKLSEANSLDEAEAWLDKRERFVALHDRALLALIARLGERRIAVDPAGGSS